MENNSSRQKSIRQQTVTTSAKIISCNLLKISFSSNDWKQCLIKGDNLSDDNYLVVIPNTVNWILSGWWITLSIYSVWSQSRYFWWPISKNIYHLVTHFEKQVKCIFGRCISHYTGECVFILGLFPFITR